ncbi:SdrD B-like domain-containing protein [Frondihabitans australicus]|uniref:Putative repeat protein (TIGR01451 family) n=1 Tax=Frondihabitans australicus TaxID=386892 RepID=A0A495IK30_9MICO|nr:SdrD B-like domain-containing protein [Frondihabitans australicus]RKR75651.1 putative repeat protein (TIGR01451 family) [Frondihabitans australicus]
MRLIARRGGLVAGLALIALAAPGIAAAPVPAGVIQLSIGVTADGSGPFSASQQAGGDTGPSNGIVRTNDTITYSVSVNSNDGHTDNETFSLTAPSGTTWAGVPAQCLGPGSELSGSRLVCNLGTVESGNTRAVPAVLTVGDGLANGAVVAVEGVLTGDGAAPVSATSRSTTVSASPRYDLSKSIQSPILTRGVVGPNGSTRGLSFLYPIAVTWNPLVAGQGLAGHERLSGAMTFTDDVSKMTGPAASTAQLLPDASGQACGLNTSAQFRSLPNGSGGAPRGVQGSGTISCTQSAPGAPITVTIAGTDTSLASATLPSLSASGGPIAGGSANYVAVMWLRVWTPTPAAGVGYNAQDSYSALQATSISGQSNYGAAGEPLANNAATWPVIPSGNGSGIKNLSIVDPETGAESNGSARTGDPFRTPGTLTGSQVVLTNPGLSTFTGSIVCDVFDNRHETIAKGADGHYAAVQNGSPGARVEFAASTWTTNEAARTATCDDDDATWYDSPEDVPGGLSAVGRVRMLTDVPGNGRADLLLYTRINADVPTSTDVWDYASFDQGSTSSRGWVHASTPTDTPSALSDYVTVTQNLARVTQKIVETGTDPSTTPDTTQFVTPGNDLDYALYPTLTNASSDTAPTTLRVVDTLPVGVSYVAGSGSIEPTSIEAAAGPGGSTVQRLVWALDGTAPNTVITPIRFVSHVSSSAQAGPIVNTVAVSTAGDVSAPALRRATRSVQVIATGGMSAVVSAIEPVVVAGDDLGWNLDYTNTDSTPVTDTDLIDVFPYNGDPRRSSFHGGLGLAKPVEIDTSKGETVRYTDGDPFTVSTDGAADSNQPGGSTVWCALDQLGATGCPSSLAGVTAIRLQREAPVAPGATVTHELRLATDGAENDDHYVNRFGLRASNLALAVESRLAPVDVVTGAVGDHVWFDANRNGLQDSGEKPAAGVAVRLAGVDDLGHAVRATTTTGGRGDYLFDGLRPGRYTVSFSAPAGSTWTRAHAGSNTALDSDVDARGVAGPFDITAETASGGGLTGVERDLTIDAGLVSSVTTPEPGGPDESVIVPPGGGHSGGGHGGAGGTTSGGGGALAFTGATGVFAALALALAAMAGGVMLIAVRRRRRSIDRPSAR